MPESVLTLCKYGFLALVFLFLWMVVRAALRELRAPVLVGAGAGAGVGTAPAPKPAPPVKAFATLRVVAPPAREGELVPVDGEITVGRGGGCALVIADDQYASTVHARVYRSGRDLVVEDLGSRNGTYVNGERIDGPVRLRRDDRVQFGQTVCDVSR